MCCWNESRKHTKFIFRISSVSLFVINTCGWNKAFRILFYFLRRLLLFARERSLSDSQCRRSRTTQRFRLVITSRRIPPHGKAGSQCIAECVVCCAEEVISGIFLLTILRRFMVAKFKYKGIILDLRLKRICACVVREERRRRREDEQKKGFKSPPLCVGE